MRGGGRRFGGTNEKRLTGVTRGRQCGGPCSSGGGGKNGKRSSISVVKGIGGEEREHRSYWATHHWMENIVTQKSVKCPYYSYPGE